MFTPCPTVPASRPSTPFVASKINFRTCCQPEGCFESSQREEKKRFLKGHIGSTAMFPSPIFHLPFLRAESEVQCDSDFAPIQSWVSPARVIRVKKPTVLLFLHEFPPDSRQHRRAVLFPSFPHGSTWEVLHPIPENISSVTQEWALPGELQHLLGAGKPPQVHTLPPPPPAAAQQYSLVMPRGRGVQAPQPREHCPATPGASHPGWDDFGFLSWFLQNWGLTRARNHCPVQRSALHCWACPQAWPATPPSLHVSVPRGG